MVYLRKKKINVGFFGMIRKSCIMGNLWEIRNMAMAFKPILLKNKLGKDNLYMGPNQAILKFIHPPMIILVESKMDIFMEKVI